MPGPVTLTAVAAFVVAVEEKMGLIGKLISKCRDGIVTLGEKLASPNPDTLAAITDLKDQLSSQIDAVQELQESLACNKSALDELQGAVTDVAQACAAHDAKLEKLATLPQALHELAETLAVISKRVDEQTAAIDQLPRLTTRVDVTAAAVRKGQAWLFVVAGIAVVAAAVSVIALLD